MSYIRPCKWDRNATRRSKSGVYTAAARTNIPTFLAFCQLDHHPSCARVADYRLLTAAASMAASISAGAGATRKPRRRPSAISETPIRHDNPRFHPPVKLRFDPPIYLGFTASSPVMHRQQQFYTAITIRSKLYFQEIKLQFFAIFDVSRFVSYRSGHRCIRILIYQATYKLQRHAMMNDCKSMQLNEARD